MKLIKAASTFPKRRGAVFIFADFKKAIDCIITDSPPNPQIKLAIGNVKKVIFVENSIFNPLVLSRSPTASDFDCASFLKIREKRVTSGDKILKSNRICVKK